MLPTKFCALSASLVCVLAGSALAQETSCPRNYSSLTRAINTFLAANPTLNGCSLVVNMDGVEVYARKFRDVGPDTTIANIASATKALSAVTVMTLVDDGVLELNDRAATFISAFGSGLEATITLRECFSHTSGLLADNACLNERFNTLENCANQIAAAGLRTQPSGFLVEPGTDFYYGGASMQVGGRMAEVAAAAAWVDLFQTKLRGPMSLTSVQFGSTSNPRIAGGASSSARDYAKVFQMLLDDGMCNGARILSPASVRAMEIDQTRGVPITSSPAPDGVRYGLGLWRDIVDDSGRAIQLSDQGAFGFSPWYDTTRQIVGVLAVQNTLENVRGLVTQLQDLCRKIHDSSTADLNYDGFVTGDDYDGFADAFLIGDEFADFDDNGFVNGDDYDQFVRAFELGC